MQQQLQILACSKPKDLYLFISEAGDLSLLIN